MASGEHGTFTKGGQVRTPATAAQAVRLKFDGWSEVDESIVEPETGEILPPPAKNAATDEWLAYARGFGDVEVDDDAKRGDIIAAVAEAGHPTEAPEVTS